MKPDAAHSHIKPALSISPDEYMQDRVIYKLLIYEVLARRYRRCYQWMSAIAIVLATSVPVLIHQGTSISLAVPIVKCAVSGTQLATVLSVIVAILAGLEKLFGFREIGRNYDMIAAALRREQLLYQTLTEEYAVSDKSQDPFRTLVTRVEDLIAHERHETISARTKQQATPS